MFVTPSKSCNPKAKKATTSDHICNPKTGRWIKKTGKIAKQLIGTTPRPQPRPQPRRNKTCNPKAKKATSDHICNPKTGRWIKKTGKIAKQLIRTTPKPKQKQKPKPRPKSDKNQVIVSIVPTPRATIFKHPRFATRAQQYTLINRAINLGAVYDEDNGLWTTTPLTRERLNNDRRKKVQHISNSDNLPLSIRELKLNKLNNDKHKVARAFKAGKKSNLSIRDATDFMKNVAFANSRIKLKKIDNRQAYIPSENKFCKTMFKNTVTQYKIINPPTRGFQVTKNIYGTKFGFHGTNINNIHKLVPEHFNLGITTNGRVGGSGVYLTQDLNVALTYTVKSNNIVTSEYIKYREDPVFVLVVEYVNHTNYKKDLFNLKIVYNNLDLITRGVNVTVVTDTSKARIVGLLKFENMGTVQKMLKNVKKYCSVSDISPQLFAARFNP